MILASLALMVASTSYRTQFPLPNLTVPNGWGVNIHFNDPQPGEMEKLAGAGFRWIRQDLAWNSVEKEKGRYDFEPLARLFEACRKNGVRPLIILDYGNDLYQQGSPRSPESRAAFCRMVEALMARFKGKGAIWEMWNEPNIFFWQPKPNVEEYIALATEVGKTIRRVAPEEYYVGPGTSGFDWEFLDRCFKAGLLEYWDAVTVHPYRQMEPETAMDDWARLKSMIAAQRKDVPMFSGEWGYSELYSGMSKERQALYIARQYLTNLMSGVPLSIWYDWKDDGRDPKEVEHHFGTLMPDLSPKPAYGAAKALSDALRGYTYHMRLAQKSPDAFLLAFRRGSDVKYVAWSKKPGDLVVLPHGEAVRVGEAPKVLTAPKGPATSLLLSWTALPSTLRVGSDEEAAAAMRSLRVGAPKGVLVQLPTIQDRPDVPEQHVKVRIAMKTAAVEQAVTVVQTRPVSLSLLSHEGKVAVVIRNPGGRVIDGLIGVTQSNIREETEVAIAPTDSTVVKQTHIRTDLGPVNVALVLNHFENQTSMRPDRAPSSRTLASLKGVKLMPIGLRDGSFSLVDDGDSKLKGIYTVKAGPELRIAYEFPVGWKFFQIVPRGASAKPIPGKPSSLNMMVWSDGSGDLLRMRFTDSTGQTFQPDYGSLDWKGWRPVSFRLDASGGRWGGANDGVIHYPIRIEAIALVDSPGGRGGKGSVAFRDAVVQR